MTVRGKENNSKEMGNESEQKYKGNIMERSRKRQGTEKEQDWDRKAKNGKGKEGAEKEVENKS